MMSHSTTPVLLSTGKCRYGAGSLGQGHWRGESPCPSPLVVGASFSAHFNQGGLVGSDETVALTAFVVITLHHGLAVFPDKNSEQLRRVVRQLCVCPSLIPFLSEAQSTDLPSNFFQENSISRANTFLGAKATSGLLGTHASAITAYALSLTEPPEDLRNIAHNNLMALAQDIGGDSVLA